MKPEEQRIAIAEACGWKPRNHCKGFYREGRDSYILELPDYLNDLNAVTEQRDRLAEALEYVVDDLDFEICERIGHSDKWCSLISAREALQSLTTNAERIHPPPMKTEKQTTRSGGLDDAPCSAS